MVQWQSWMEGLDDFRSSPRTYARPAQLGSLGSDTYLVEPCALHTPHRVHIGSEVGVDVRFSVAVVDDCEESSADPTVRIGDGCLIGHDVTIYCVAGVYVGDRVGIAARAFVTDALFTFDGRGGRAPGPAAPVRICDGAFLGAGSVVLPGVTVGERAVVSTGSLVAEDVPARSVVFGSPARIVRSWDEQAQQWRLGG